MPRVRRRVGCHGAEEMALMQFYGREVLKDALPLLLISEPARCAFSIALVLAAGDFRQCLASDREELLAGTIANLRTR